MAGYSPQDLTEVKQTPHGLPRKQDQKTPGQYPFVGELRFDTALATIKRVYDDVTARHLRWKHRKVRAQIC